MINSWTLPTSASIGGVTYTINADFRDVLDIISYLNDTQKPEFLRWQIAVGLFYEGDIPQEHFHEAVDFLAEFISYGETENRPGPKLLDWEQDSQIIIGDVIKVAGVEIRGLPFLHWWTFLSYFYGIGEGQLATIVSIRDKKRKGKKLEDWEKEYYKNNKSRVDFSHKKTKQYDDMQEYFNKWL